MAKKKVAVKVKRKALPRSEEMFVALLGKLTDVAVGISHVHAALLGSTTRDRQHEKVEMFEKQLAILERIAEGQKALSDTILLLTAKGVTKAKEKKEPTPQAIVEQVNQMGREIGAEQRVAAAAPPAAEEKKAPDLKVVPPLVSTVSPPSPTATDENKAAPTLDQLRTTFLNYVARHGRDKGVELLKNFGVQKLTDVPPAQFERFASACA